MGEMDVDQRKAWMYDILTEAESDIETLKKNIEKARADLATVQTEAEAKAFDRGHDLEEGLKHIELF